MSKFGLLLLFLASSLTIGSTLTLPAQSQKLPSTRLPIINPNAELPEKLAEKLIQHVSRDTKTSIANVKITEAKFLKFEFIDTQKKGLPKQVIQTWDSVALPSRPIVQTETDVKVAKLQQFLKVKQWAKADQETRLLLRDLSNVPNSLIQSIDQVWLQESNNRFGLSVQAKIWRESMAKYPKDSQKATDAFRDRLGWKLTQPRKENDFISSDWLNESELNYSAKAPIGHLPWAGVSDAEVASLMSGVGEGCGSCTTDAMQLRNERFYLYLPQLFDRVKQAIAP